MATEMFKTVPAVNPNAANLKGDEHFFYIIILKKRFNQSSYIGVTEGTIVVLLRMKNSLIIYKMVLNDLRVFGVRTF